MGLKVVPSSDLSTSAAVASHVGVLDYGFLQAGEFLSRSVRIANDSAESVVWHGASSDADGLVQVSPAEGTDSLQTLAPDEISDTVTITIDLPIEAESGARSIDIIFSADNGDETTLRLDYVAVGVNVARDSQYPERATTFTDNVSSVVTRAAEPLRLLTFEPIPYSPSDNRVILDFSKPRHLDEGGEKTFITQSVDERLNPLNETWGYVRSETVIVGSFQSEMNETTASFESMNTTTDYMAKARLYVSADYEFPRTWGLFSVGRSPDTDQYKRTVYVIERRGEFWALHSIITKFRGNEIAYTAADLVQIEPRNMGSADQYNPFAWTYRAESDKPYAMFTVPTPDLGTIITDGSAEGSATMLNPSEALNPSIAPPPAPEPEPEATTITLEAYDRWEVVWNPLLGYSANQGAPLDAMASTGTGGLSRIVVEWDISSIPIDATDVSYRWTYRIKEAATDSSPLECYNVNVQPSVEIGDPETVWFAYDNLHGYVTGEPDEADVTFDPNATGDSDLQTAVSSWQGWFALMTRWQDEGATINKDFGVSRSNNLLLLEVTYY